jgi:hypothetical protein
MAISNLLLATTRSSLCWRYKSHPLKQRMWLVPPTQGVPGDGQEQVTAISGGCKLQISEMFVHLGRTLSEASNVFALGRIWLGAAKFLTFRDSAQHKLQILTYNKIQQHTTLLLYYISVHTFITTFSFSLAPFTYTFISHFTSYTPHHPFLLYTHHYYSPLCHFTQTHHFKNYTFWNDVFDLIDTLENSSPTH